jgi:hypothetical protein
MTNKINPATASPPEFAVCLTAAKARNMLMFSGTYEREMAINYTD